MTDWYITPSGSQVQLAFEGTSKHPDRDMTQHWVRVLGPDGKTEDRLYVGVLSPILISAAVQKQLQLEPGPAIDRAVKKAAVLAYDQLETLPRDDYNNAAVEVGTEAVISLLTPAPPSDVTIRRYLARLLYSEYSRDTLNTVVEVGDEEALILGARPLDLRRNAELLEAEGLLAIAGGLAFPLLLKPTAALIRQVERYGAAREDVVPAEDYTASIGAYPALAVYSAGLIHEYQRHQVAQSDIELISVFRAISPIIESILKDLLRAHGSPKDHPTLGPAIADLHSRSLGGAALLSQLNHVLKFARDLAQHGSALPIPVLRIACENAFSLAPQLGALFPR